MKDNEGQGFGNIKNVRRPASEALADAVSTVKRSAPKPSTVGSASKGLVVAWPVLIGPFLLTFFSPVTSLS